jgi:hypothetical protein
VMKFVIATLPICTFADQENSTLLEWPEPVSPLVPVCQRISWIDVDMPESSTCAGGENHWNQWAPELDLVLYTALVQVHENLLSFVRFHGYCRQLIIIQLHSSILIQYGIVFNGEHTQ